MKTTMRQLRRLIREELDLGDVVFSPSRRDGAPRDEPNTPVEEKLFAGFKDWVEETDWARLSGFLRELEAILGSPGAKYSDFFRSPPRGTPLYRGMQAVRATRARCCASVPPGSRRSVGASAPEFFPLPRV
jgi:hypothetical protein